MAKYLLTHVGFTLKGFNSLFDNFGTQAKNMPPAPACEQLYFEFIKYPSMKYIPIFCITRLPKEDPASRPCSPSFRLLLLPVDSTSIYYFILVPTISVTLRFRFSLINFNFTFYFKNSAIFYN